MARVGSIYVQGSQHSCCQICFAKHILTESKHNSQKDTCCIAALGGTWNLPATLCHEQLPIPKSTSAKQKQGTQWHPNCKQLWYVPKFPMVQSCSNIMNMLSGLPSGAPRFFSLGSTWFSCSLHPRTIPSYTLSMSAFIPSPDEGF